MAPTPFSYGRFYGAPCTRIEVPGFSASLMTATVPLEDVPVHRHSNASMIYVSSGRYHSSADGVRKHCDGGTLIFNPSGTVHRDSFEAPGDRFLAISATDETTGLINQVCSLTSSAVAISSGHPVAIAAAMCIGDRSIICLGHVGAIEEACWDLVSAFAGEKFWREDKPIGWVRRARELLQDECSANLRLSDVATRLDVHPVYFSRAFRKVFRCTPQRYLVRCRLQKAMQLLRVSAAPISQIAIDSGFYDQSHFSRLFSQHFGIAPNKYRRELGLSPRGRQVQPVQEQIRASV